MSVYITYSGVKLLFIIILWAGLKSAKNVELFQKGDYRYRIKKRGGTLKETIKSTTNKNGTFKDILYPDGNRMIVGYFDERAKKNTTGNKA